MNFCSVPNQIDLDLLKLGVKQNARHLRLRDFFSDADADEGSGMFILDRSRYI